MFPQRDALAYAEWAGKSLPTEAGRPVQKVLKFIRLRTN
jgi:hypothetical protein